jgi:predicted amidohydrolase YtcJ
MSSTKLFVNGRIFTSQPGDEALHQAMLVEGEKVICVGTNEHVIQKASRVSRDTYVQRIQPEV